MRMSTDNHILKHHSSGGGGDFGDERFIDTIKQVERCPKKQIYRVHQGQMSGLSGSTITFPQPTIPQQLTMDDGNSDDHRASSRDCTMLTSAMPVGLMESTDKQNVPTVCRIVGSSGFKWKQVDK